jgi:hypothetical protein
MVNIFYAVGRTTTNIQENDYRIGKLENVSPESGTEIQSQPIYFLSRPIEGTVFNPSTDFLYFKDVQAERLPYATPFVNGTRGTTVATGGGVINQSKINSNNGTISNPFASPEEAQKFGYPAGNYYFKSGSMGSAELLEFAPNYYEGKPFCCVFRSPYRSTATTNKIGLNIPMGGLLVQRDTLDLRAAVYWSAPITYNSVGGSGNNTADSGHTPRRVILGFAGGHGIFATNQNQCNWGNATGAIGAGWDGSTCGSFPNDLVWGTGRSDTATYENRSGIWSHWITWTDFNAGGELVNGVTFSRDNQGSFLFDGVNDYLFTTGVQTADYMSLSCWFKTTTQQVNKYLVAMGFNLTGNNGFDLTFQNTQIGSYVAVSGSNSGGIFHTTNYYDGNWHHICTTYDGSVARFYYDGVEVATRTGMSGGIQIESTKKLNIGSWVNNSANANTSISLVSLYNRALLTSEIIQNYNATKGRFGL